MGLSEMAGALPRTDQKPLLALHRQCQLQLPYSLPNTVAWKRFSPEEKQVSTTQASGRLKEREAGGRKQGGFTGSNSIYNQKAVKPQYHYRNVQMSVHSRRGSQQTSHMGSLLQQLDQDYAVAHQQIASRLGSLPRTVQIRLREWVKKFDAVVDVVAWKKNRNVYAKVLLAMLKEQAITCPFHTSPPATALPTLSLFQLPARIRQTLADSKQNKQNCSLAINSQQEGDNYLNKHRNKQKYSLQNRLVQVTHLEDTPVHDQDDLTREIAQLMRNSYDFLSRHAHQLPDPHECQDLLEELWNCSNLHFPH